jgi:hypothetical protein
MFGGWTVSEPFAGTRSVVVIADPPGHSRPDNAVFFNEDGTERVCLKSLDFREKHQLIGYYTAYGSGQQLVVVYATRTGDFWGTPDFDTGELRDVREWRRRLASGLPVGEQPCNVLNGQRGIAGRAFTEHRVVVGQETRRRS